MDDNSYCTYKTENMMSLIVSTTHYPHRVYNALYSILLGLGLAGSLYHHKLMSILGSPHHVPHCLLSL